MLRKLLIMLLAMPVSVLAADRKYPVSEIPAALKDGADAVVRTNVIISRVKSKSLVTQSTKLVVTILNPKGDGFARYPIGYDKLTRVSDIKAAAYDANGEQIKRLKASEIVDVSAFDDNTLFSDNRLKILNLEQTVYPYTVEYEYETEYRYLYSFLGDRIVPDDRVSVQYFYKEITYPLATPIRYKTLNVQQQPTKKTNGDGTETIGWEVRDLSPVKPEPIGPLWSEIVPQVMVAPTTFEYAGYSGSMETWKDYGQWLYELTKGRDILPEATKQKILQLTKDATTTEQKTRILYEYLQSRTRYIYIALGIGGLQPFDAATVDKMGYGDCKALSNYMVAMLKEAGVKSFYSVIWAGTGPQVDVAFPSHQANHAIVGVPNGADTIWLECTSQTNPFGYQGSNTGDRYAMAITEEGGKLVRTNRYPAAENLLVSSADVIVEPTGNAKAKIRSTFSGLQYENGDLHGYVNMTSDVQKKWIQKNISIPNFDVTSFKMQNVKDRHPKAVVEADLSLNRFASVNGKRLFITPNLMNRHSYIPEKNDNRKYDVVIRTGFIDLDTIRYQIPENAYPEFLPQQTKISSRFGDYECSYTMEQGKLVYIRRMTMKNGTYPAGTYQELSEFYRNVNKADNVKVVLLTKT